MYFIVAAVSQSISLYALLVCVYACMDAGYADGCNIYWATVDAFGCTSFQTNQAVLSYADICREMSIGHAVLANVSEVK